MKKDDAVEPSAEDVARCLDVLRAVARLPDDHPVRQTVERAATQVQRGMKKRLRRQRHRAVSEADRSTVQALMDARREENGVRDFSAPREPEAPAQVSRPRRCYVCKQGFTQLHPVYLSLCPTCAELSEARRGQHVSLEGRRALVTGGRVKVGFHVALWLLRDGAHVHVTSRFPHDAALRFSREPDFAKWRERLVLHELDLRFPQRVLAFTEHLCATEPHLDILINNAAQTVRLSPEQSAALLAQEHALARALEAPARALVHALPGLAAPDVLPAGGGEAHALRASSASATVMRVLGVSGALATSAIGFEALSSELPRALDLPPAREEDNAWVKRLDEVSPVEVLEAQLVNAIAPFLLNGQLKPLLLRSPFPDRYIVNVSAVEGQFERRGKTVFHPHTNMAKAALNMMTRTSAEDYARDGIYMNSVDPGWVSNENPDTRRRRMEEEGFSPPLDGTDAAARVCEPILRGLQGQPVHGRFLKDFRDAPW
ncbi:SDR family NAD(P)-dependent oxidoreductase [Pyxidicoccus parkwayensis]|uniref:SDR family NAD(P)-dependent oxidoreductase n=1 Tax=Pyxidicoccus parkwayensis TaxID=2813578 RepID=A0ABX7NRE8_9BACT|nr:SDR family oxidoreductase [Pyxidicoccus parkwaysis]QSQ21013.1 SDR family NAD(P)-dependent oxidoreductase [Pyxidicoccus parkwaysis]